MKTLIVVFVCAVLACVSARSKTLVKLTEDNWLQINKGEWMIELYVYNFVSYFYGIKKHVQSLIFQPRTVVSGVQGSGENMGLICVMVEGFGNKCGRNRRHRQSGSERSLPGHRTADHLSVGANILSMRHTYFSVKDGVFRMYQGPRDKEDFMKFIEDKKWTVVEPISQWKNPESIQFVINEIFLI